MDDRWLTVEEAAAQIQVHPETIRRWLRDGKVTGVLISRSGGYRIRQSELDRFLEERTTDMGKAAA
ncbi:MAG: helix-turn-helix domain-containing protein [Chloroflexota bacterium]|nr:helix-turn-helix domain-containing protein [Chloroflexota bacterium]